MKTEKVLVKSRNASREGIQTKKVTEAFGKVIPGMNLNDQIKIKFQVFLEKLNDKDTRQIGFNEMKLLINKYNDKEHLVLYMPYLLHYEKSSTVIGKEFQIILIGYAIKTCGHEAIGGERGVNRIVESLLNFLRDNSVNIQKSCSHAMIELFDAMITIQTESQTIVKVLIDPLFELMNKSLNSGSYKKNKHPCIIGASVILSDLVMHIRDNECITEELLNAIFQYTLVFINKHKLGVAHLFEATNALLEKIALTPNDNNIKYLFDRLCSVLISNDTSLYQNKIECCNLLITLAGKVDNLLFSDQVINSLKYACKDRVTKVQIAAGTAIKYWDSNYNVQDPQSQTKMNKLSLLRNLSKMNKTRKHTLSPDDIKEAIYTKGIDSLLKTTDFMNSRDNSEIKQMKNKRSKEKKDFNSSTAFLKSFKAGSRSNFKGKADSNNITVYYREEEKSMINHEDDQTEEEIFDENENKTILSEDLNNNAEECIPPTEREIDDEICESDADSCENEEMNDIVEDPNIKEVVDINVVSKQRPKVVFDEEINRGDNFEVDENTFEDNYSQSKVKKLQSKKAVTNFEDQDKTNHTLDHESNFWKTKVKKKQSKIVVYKAEDDISDPRKKLQSKKTLRFIDENEIKGTESSMNETLNRSSIVNRKETMNLKSSLRKSNTIKQTSNLINNQEFCVNREIELTYTSMTKPIEHDFTQIDSMISSYENILVNKINKMNSKINKIKSMISQLAVKSKKNILEESLALSIISPKQNNDERTRTFRDNYEGFDSPLISTWQSIISDLENNNKSKAYDTAIKSEDDIILLRLLFLTGPCLEELEREIGKSLLLRMNMISRCKFIEHIVYKTIEKSNDIKLLDDVDTFNKNEILETLFEFSSMQNSLGQNSLALYNTILSNF